MFLVIEISRPFQLKPGWTKIPGRTSFRFWWLFFAFSIHPMRFDEMISLANDGRAVWGKR